MHVLNASNHPLVVKVISRDASFYNQAEYLLDLQMVNIGLRVLHRPNMMQLPEVYRNLGKDYDDRVLPSIMNEVQHNMMFIYLLLSLFL